MDSKSRDSTRSDVVAQVTKWIASRRDRRLLQSVQPYTYQATAEVAPVLKPHVLPPSVAWPVGAAAATESHALTLLVPGAASVPEGIPLSCRFVCDEGGIAWKLNRGCVGFLVDVTVPNIEVPDTLKDVWKRVGDVLTAIVLLRGFPSLEAFSLE